MTKKEEMLMSRLNEMSLELASLRSEAKILKEINKGLINALTNKNKNDGGTRINLKAAGF